MDLSLRTEQDENDVTVSWLLPSENEIQQTSIYSEEENTFAKNLKGGKSIDTKKYNLIMEWLKSKYGNEHSIPPFEASPENLSILWSIYQKNQKRNTEIKLSIQNLTLKQKEYKSETSRFKEILMKCGIPNLDSEGIDPSLEELAYLATILDTRDCSDSSLMLALIELEKQFEKVKDQKERLLQKKKELSIGLKQYLNESNSEQQFLAEQKRSHSKLEQNKRQFTENISYMEGKSFEYQQTISKLKEQLQNIPISELNHSSLLQIVEKIQNLEKQLSPKRKLLSSYYDLPFDIDETKKKIEMAKTKLNEIEQELSKKVTEFI